MTADDLRALSAAATSGPWVAEGKNVLAADEQGLAILAAMCPLGADAELILWLRNHADAIADLAAAIKAIPRHRRWNDPRTYGACMVCAAPWPCPTENVRAALVALDADA